MYCDKNACKVCRHVWCMSVCLYVCDCVKGVSKDENGSVVTAFLTLSSTKDES